MMIVARQGMFVLALTAVLAILIAAPATADPPLTAHDQQFLETLKQAGWIAECPPNQLFVGCKVQGYVKLAHDQCNALRTYPGRTPRDQANNDSWYVVKPGSPKAFSFVKASIQSYCPQYLSQVDW